MWTLFQVEARSHVPGNPVGKVQWGVDPPSGVRLQEPPGHGRGLRQDLSEAAHALQRECPLRVLPEAFPRAQTRWRAG